MKLHLKLFLYLLSSQFWASDHTYFSSCSTNDLTSGLLGEYSKKRQRKQELVCWLHSCVVSLYVRFSLGQLWRDISTVLFYTSCCWHSCWQISRRMQTPPRDFVTYCQCGATIFLCVPDIKKNIHEWETWTWPHIGHVNPTKAHFITRHNKVACLVFLMWFASHCKWADQGTLSSFFRHHLHHHLHHHQLNSPV